MTAQKAEAAVPYRQLKKHVNTSSSLIESIVAGRQQAAMVPEVFALDDECSDGLSRMHMTEEAAVQGRGTMAEEFAAPAHLRYHTFPSGFIARGSAGTGEGP